MPDSDHRIDRARRKRFARSLAIPHRLSRASPTSRPLRFLTNFRDEIKAVVRSINIAGMDNTDRVRQVAQSTVDELFSLMKPPSTD